MRGPRPLVVVCDTRTPGIMGGGGIGTCTGGGRLPLLLAAREGGAPR